MSGKAEEEANSPHEEGIFKHTFLAVEQHFLKMHSTPIERTIKASHITSLHYCAYATW